MTSEITLYYKANHAPSRGYNGQGSPDTNYTVHYGANMLVGTGKAATIEKMIKHLRAMNARGMNIAGMATATPEKFSAYNQCVIPAALLTQAANAPIDRAQLKFSESN